MSNFLCLFASERHRLIIAGMFAYELHHRRRHSRKPKAAEIIADVASGLRRRIWQALSEQEGDTYAALLNILETNREEAIGYVETYR